MAAIIKPSLARAHGLAIWLNNTAIEMDISPVRAMNLAARNTILLTIVIEWCAGAVFVILRSKFVRMFAEHRRNCADFKDISERLLRKVAVLPICQLSDSQQAF